MRDYAIRLRRRNTWCSLLEDGELVAESEDLGLEFGPRSEAGPKGGEEGSDVWVHSGCTLSTEPGKLNRLKTYEVFARDTALLAGDESPMPGTAVIRLAITGANSAVGQAIVRASTKWRTGVELVACVRSEHAAGELQPWMDRISLARIAYDDPTRLCAAFHGASAIVHLAGILIERPGSTYQGAHVETTRSVLEAAKACGVNCIVYVSAIGADPTSRNRYWRTKGQAMTLVRQSGLRYTILRPPLLLGPGTEGTTTLNRYLREGRATMINGGRTFQQPLDVGDLARAAPVAADGLAFLDALSIWLGRSP